MKKVSKILFASLVIVAAVGVFAACAPADSNEKSLNTVFIDINPSVELVADADGKVVSVRGENDDAEVLLYNEEIEGKTVEEAVQKIVELSVDLGYIDGDESAISVMVSASSDSEKSKLYASVDASVSAAAAAKSVQLTAVRAADYVLEKELAYVKENNKDKAGYASLTVEKYRLVKAVLFYDDTLTRDQAVQLSEKDLNEKLAAAHTERDEYLTRAQENAEKVKQRAYEEALALANDAAYVEVYANRLKDNPLLITQATTYLGVKYMAFDTAYRTLRNIADTYRYAIANIEVSDSTVNVLATALNIKSEDRDAFEEKLENEDGKITVDSVSSYINKLYRNADEQQKVSLDASLSASSAELVVTAEAGREVDGSYKASINSALTALQGSLVVSADISIDSTLLNKFKNLSDIDDLDELVIAVKAETDAVLTQINSNLTAEEKETVAQKQADTTAQFETTLEQLNAAIAQIRTDAASALKAAKEARLDLNVEVEVG